MMPQLALPPPMWSVELPNDVLAPPAPLAVLPDSVDRNSKVNPSQPARCAEFLNPATQVQQCRWMNDKICQNVSWEKEALHQPIRLMPKSSRHLASFLGNSGRLLQRRYMPTCRVPSTDQHADSGQPAAPSRRAPQRKVSKKSMDMHVCSPKASVAEFFKFMQKREELRIRKDVRQQPQSEWTGDAVLKSVRLTNVQREKDRTTLAMRELTGEQAQLWEALDTMPEAISCKPVSMRKPWTKKQLELAGLFVFNCALWRAFGTAEFARARGFVQDWSLETQAETLEITQVLWRHDIDVFTEAYDPARSRHRHEISQRQRNPKDGNSVGKVVRRVFESVAIIWRDRELIAKEAYVTGSQKATTERLMKISGYGGTGFLAKEVVQDLLHTPVFEDYVVPPDNSKPASWVCVCTDENEWCAVGPGARRGLNRLHGRPVKWCIMDSSPAKQHEFLAEIRELFEGRHENGHWPTSLLGLELADLVLHDVQFQLCEFDKYQRALYQEGRFRVYNPPASKRLTREELEILVQRERKPVTIEVQTTIHSAFE